MQLRCDVDKLFYLAILVIVTERATEIIVDSKLFEPIREGIKNRVYTDPPKPDSILQRAKIMLDYLVNCGYCVSGWVGGLVSALRIGYSLPEFIARFFLFDFLNWLIYAVFLQVVSVKPSTCSFNHCISHNNLYLLNAKSYIIFISFSN